MLYHAESWRWAAVIALLAIMEAVMLLAVRQESQTSDEAYSMLAGYLHLTAGDFAICPGYPPLAKEVSALPLLVLRPRVPPMTDAEASDFRGGRIFLYANRADQLLFAARAAMTVFPLLLAAFVFLAAWEMFGIVPAFIGLGLIAFEPNILAHGPLVANDVSLACWLFAAVYAFWRYVLKPNAWRLAACGISAGFSLAAKHSGIILFPILFLLALVELLSAACSSQGSDSRGGAITAMTPHGQDARATPSRSLAPRLFMALLVIAAIAVATLWSFYGFRYSATPDAQPNSPPLNSSLGAVQSRGRSRRDRFGGASTSAPGGLSGRLDVFLYHQLPPHVTFWASSTRTESGSISPPHSSSSPPSGFFSSSLLRSWLDCHARAKGAAKPCGC